MSGVKVFFIPASEHRWVFGAEEQSANAGHFFHARFYSWSLMRFNT
jgi:hypothetical protein